LSELAILSVFQNKIAQFASLTRYAVLNYRDVMFRFRDFVSTNKRAERVTA